MHSKEVWLEEELTKSKMVLSQKMKETTSTLEEYEDYKQTLELTTQTEIEHIRQLSTQAVEEAEAVSLRGLLDAWHCCVCWYIGILVYVGGQACSVDHTCMIDHTCMVDI